MGTITLLFAAVAVAIGLVQTISHLGGGSSYVFGNSHFFGVILEFMVLGTTLLTGGTVSGFLINTLAGLMIYSILELGKVWKGGTKVHFSFKDMKNGNFGFSTSEIAPTMSAEKLGEMVVNTIVGFFKSCAVFAVSIFTFAESKLNAAAANATNL